MVDYIRNTLDILSLTVLILFTLISSLPVLMRFSDWLLGGRFK